MTGRLAGTHGFLTLIVCDMCGHKEDRATGVAAMRIHLLRHKGPGPK